MLLSKDQILAAQDRRETVVEVPEWGGQIRLMEMSGADRAAYLSSIFKYGTNEKGEVTVEGDPTNADAKLLARTIVDEDGNRVFSEEDIIALGQKNGLVLDRLSTEANKLNALTPTAVDDATGKSEPIQNSDSTSD